MPQKRNDTISIAKGIAIICVVLGHCGMPGSGMLYAFHMPLFFLTAGYFFNLKYLSRKGEFIRRRFKGLYIPFVKWSFVFLLLNNVWFHCGVMNERYGNAAGGLLHPYTWRQGVQNAVSVLSNMSGYEVCMGGAFWFFRALLVASVAFLLLYAWGDSRCPARWKGKPCKITVLTWGIALLALLLATLKVTLGFNITGLAQGGHRDLMGLFFFSLGFLYRYYEPKAGLSLFMEKDASSLRWKVTGEMILCAFVVAAWVLWWRLPFGMPYKAASVLQVWGVIPPAVCGSLLVYRLSGWIGRYETLLRRFLVYCGNNTLYVFVFHFLTFKLVNLLKIVYYGLPYDRMGYYPVIHEHTDDYFWIVYTVAGVGLPLAGIYLYRKIRNSFKHETIHY